MNNALKETERKKGASLVNDGVSSSLFLIMLSVISVMSLITSFVTAEPEGMSIVSNFTESKQTASPDNRSDEGGTITTLGVDFTQQNDYWKAYVGNITGTLVLQDASGYSIYQWELESTDLTGEVYVSRQMEPSWTSIECSNETVLASEDTYMGFSSASAYSINRTFNETKHPELIVGSVTIPSDSCRSTSTYVNDSVQAQASADFPVVLLASETDVVYASPINQGSDSYRTGAKVDFQIMIPDKVDATTTYYFFAEIAD
ncbi:MAG: hypothetical protein PWQ87_133 [Candidatus Woesearchaeota archaeon]|nr:hypothetical protein [Candidatus Woesearchaeota archaeon]